jgi:hypothetical protein
MVNKWSALMLVAGSAIGYLVAAPAAGAQGEIVPFNVGDRVVLRIDASAETPVERSFTCTVGALHANWVRCDTVDPFRSQRSENWINVRSLVQIRKEAR